MEARTSVTILKPPEEVYARWKDFSRFPTFMAHVESVEVLGDGRTRWRVDGPAGTTVEWDAETLEDVPNERIAWRSVEGADVENAGTVDIAAAPGGRGTEVRVHLEYAPPLGPIGAVVAKLFGEEPNQQLSDDLRRFKQLLEVGEVVRSDGNPTGTMTIKQLVQRPAQPMAPEQAREQGEARR